ncbi:MAG: hypothetical protein QGG36_20975 [Pirellulaceae bacterium]|jgi:hypothetical protein|nr:hypothetical protein [Pirellulaceae bacterium]
MIDRRQFVASAIAASLVAHPALSRLSLANPTTAGTRELVDQLSDDLVKLEWPGRDIATAARNLKTPQAAFEFVRDGVGFVDYPGSIAGAAGTLRTRVGNATDKALLLKELLVAQGHSNVSLSKAAWPADGAADSADAWRSIKGSGDERNAGWLKALKREVGAATKAATAALATNGVGLTDSSTKAKPESDWVWVEGRINGRTVVFDAVLPQAARPSEYQSNYTPKPTSLILAVDAIGNDGKASTILSWPMKMSDVIGFDATMTLVPNDKRFRTSRKDLDPKAVNEWMVSVVIGSQIGQSALFRPEGKPKANAPKRSGGLLGGLGGGGLLGGSSSSSSVEAKSLRLRIEYELADGSVTNLSRTFQNLAKGFDASELVATHQIGIAVAGVPAAVALSRQADEIMDMGKLRLALDGDDTPIEPSFMRGMSSRSATIGNMVLAAQVATARRDLAVQWNGLAVFMESTQLNKRAGKLMRMRRIDFLQQSFAPGENATARDRIAWGIATCAAEASVYETKSLNQSILSAGKLSVTRTVRSHAGEQNVLSRVVDDGGCLIHSGRTQENVWAVQPNGELLGVYSQPGSPVQAKAVTAADVTGFGFGFAMGYVGHPAGFLATGLSYYFVELGRAYLAAATVIQGVETQISGEPLPVGYYRALDKIKNMPRDLMLELLKGLARGYASSAAAKGLGHALPGSGPVKDGLIGGGVETPSVQDAVFGKGESLANEILR